MTRKSLGSRHRLVQNQRYSGQRRHQDLEICSLSGGPESGSNRIVVQGTGPALKGAQVNARPADDDDQDSFKEVSTAP